MIIYAMLDLVETLENARLVIASFRPPGYGFVKHARIYWIYDVHVVVIGNYFLSPHVFFSISLGSPFVGVYHEIDDCQSICRSGKTEVLV